MLRPALRTIIQAFGHGADSESTTAQNEAMKVAYLELAGRRPWNWRRKSAATVATTVGNPIVTTNLPADLDYPLMVQLSFGGTSSEPLENIEPESMDDHLAQDTGTGEPIFWSFRNSQLMVYPRPDKVYTARLDYIRTIAVTEFDDDTDVLPFPEQYHPVLAYGALRVLGFRQRDTGQQGIAEQKYEAIVKQMEQADNRGKSDQRQVNIWPGWQMIRS